MLKQIVCKKATTGCDSRLLHYTQNSELQTGSTSVCG